MQYPSWRENNRHDQTYQSPQGIGASEWRIQIEQPANDGAMSNTATDNSSAGNSYQEELEQTQLFIPAYQPLVNGRE